ncbi:hypothetical protein INT47_007488 [Mucor saturninus]|uniref:HMG box domain-containing protein n=2 Tax=Mucor TaxID=4830 RepID=A0A8H7R4T8_9FUNG|nr:hypothetical protein INT47_007488 [Mucor saturninus]
MREITEEDLIALNVKRGHRRVIQRGIATLNGVPQNQPLNVIAPVSVTPPCPDLTRSNGNNSSEGSSYNTSGYGSMSSPRHPTCVGQKYDINTNYPSNPSLTEHTTEIQPPADKPSTSDVEKDIPVVVENARSSSFSSNDEDADAPLKRKYRRHPKPDKKAPIKPPSAYIMFSNDARSQLKDYGMSFVEIAKYVGDQWKNLSINQKQQYERTAMRAKDLYIEELHAYSQTDDYKKYQIYLNNFKSEQDATNRKIARLRKRAKRDSPESGSMADSSSNTEHKNVKKRTSDNSLGSSNSTDGGFNNSDENPRSSSSSGSTDIYKVHLKNHPTEASQQRKSDECSLARNSTDDSPSTMDPSSLDDENNGGECYSPQQKAPPLISDNMAESNYHRLPFNDNTAAT